MRVRYFAWLRQRMGVSVEELALPEGVTTARGLGVFLADRSPGFAEAWKARGLVRIAVNHEHIDDDAPITDADEVAFFPPVTGG